jgi:hypothetical protein
MEITRKDGKIRVNGVAIERNYFDISGGMLRIVYEAIKELKLDNKFSVVIVEEGDDWAVTKESIVMNVNTGTEVFSIAKKREIGGEKDYETVYTLEFNFLDKEEDIISSIMGLEISLIGEATALAKMDFEREVKLGFVKMEEENGTK